jgi:hypothetical protein
MPQPISVTINWDSATSKGVPSVDPILVPKSNGATVIQWSCGTDVVSFAIGGLSSSEFTPSQSAGYPNNQVTNFSTTDSNDVVGDFSYTIVATHKSGLVSRHDPKIENES